MLDPSEKIVFDGMVTHLRAEDPLFRRRIDRLCRPPRARIRRTVGILLWIIAPLCIVLGGWTGVLLAVVAAGYGTHLMVRPYETGPQPLWWTATRGRTPDQLA